MTLSKNLQDEENRFRRINVKKITSLKKLINTPIQEVNFFFDDNNKLDKISKNLAKKGNTSIKLKINDGKNNLIFKLNNKREIDRKTINLIKNKDILTTIK